VTPPGDSLSPVSSGRLGGTPWTGLAARSAASPSLSIRHNSDGEVPLPRFNQLKGSHKRTAEALAVEIQWMAKQFGIERLGFLTLTFADHVIVNAEANRRLGNLARRILKERYKRCIAVRERQESGRIHFHLVVVLAEDIRTGFDFAGIEKRDYRSAGVALRSEWSFWRRTAPLYRFGRTELLPVKSTAEGIARYVGKYVSKHIGQRMEADKGARVVRFIGFKPGDRRVSSRFGWNSDGAWLWRRKVEQFCKENRLFGMTDLVRLFGRRWAWHLQALILETELGSDVVYPSLKALDRETTLMVW